MGVDFIRAQSGKPHKKRWSNGVDRLKQPTFFDVHFGSDCHFVTATLEGDRSPVPGDELIVQLDGAGSCSAFSGLSKVATLANPPPSLLQILAANHGMAPVIVDRLDCFGTTAELRLP